jgi:AraC family transcriptional regulator, regulatory protein of adaptative response / methylated-DNA-[protein]-cysteine methyltransferase
MTRQNLRTSSADTNIRYAYGACSLGTILVASSERGVCAILLGDEPDALILELQLKHSNGKLIGDDAECGQRVSQVLDFIEMPTLGLNLALDIRGTEFQRRVWQALQEIPLGSTASYSEIAKRIGSPRAFRAVAQACAANDLAIVIPCHRVLHKDGTLSGYRGGVERKRALLERESNVN